MRENLYTSRNLLNEIKADHANILNLTRGTGLAELIRVRVDTAGRHARELFERLDHFEKMKRENPSKLSQEIGDHIRIVRLGEIAGMPLVLDGLSFVIVKDPLVDDAAREVPAVFLDASEWPPTFPLDRPYRPQLEVVNRYGSDPKTKHPLVTGILMSADALRKAGQ